MITADALLDLTEAEQAEALRQMPDYLTVALNRHFPSWAHEGQLAPGPLDDGRTWRTWVLMAGRGFGKTRSGAEWVLDCVRGGQAHPRPLPQAGRKKDGATLPRLRAKKVGAAMSPSRLRGTEGVPEEQRLGVGLSDLRIALVAATVDEARRVMVEGPSGILACAREGEIAAWSPARRELEFANGAIATLFSGASPEALRGPQHHIAWCDELAKWRHPQATWDMLQLGLRCGEVPRALVTTTPRGGCATLKRILADPLTARTGGGSHANPHLPPAFLSAIEASYGGTRAWGARRSTGCCSPMSKARCGPRR